MARSSTTAAAKTPATKKTAKKSAAKKSAEESAATTTSTRTRSKAGDVAPTLVVRDDEDAWTKAELKAVRKEIDSEICGSRARVALTRLLLPAPDGAATM